MFRVIDTVDTLITAPVQPPMTVDHARRHIRAISREDDVLIATWIQAAAQYFEAQTGRQIITATRELWMDAFPCQFYGGQWWGGPSATRQRIELPHPPLQSVVSVKYIDSTGTEQSYSDGGSPDAPFYQAKAPQGPYARRGYVEPIYGNTWPVARCEGGAVRIQYVSGYGDTPDDVPELVTGILCYLVAHFDTVRAAVHEVRRGQMLELPYGVRAMMDEFKYSAYPTVTPKQHGYGGGPWL